MLQTIVDSLQTVENYDDTFYLAGCVHGTNLRLVSMTNVRVRPQNNKGFSRIIRKWVTFFKAVMETSGENATL